MKNVDKYVNYNNKNKENICFICKCDIIPINISKIKEKKLKNLISKNNIKEFENSSLINKCNCNNNKQKVHKLCLILNIIFNFELKCNECKTNYNISISRKKNDYKNLYNICSCIFLYLFHAILYTVSVFLFLYIHTIKKNIKKNFEDYKLFHIYYFFGSIIFIINTILLIVTSYNFLDKNNKDVYEYSIDVKDIGEPNKNNINSDKYYNLLYKYYRYLYNSQIRYIIILKQKSLYISRGLGYFNKELKDYIINNNKEYKELNLFNKGCDNDILNINKISNKNFLNEKSKNNQIEKSNGLIINNHESFNKSFNYEKEEEKNEENDNDKVNKEQLISEKNTENNNMEYNPNNVDNIKNEEISNNKNNLIIIGSENNEDNNDKLNFDNINNGENNTNIINTNIHSYNLSTISDKILNKKIKKLAKTYLYKKIKNKNLNNKNKSKTSIHHRRKRRKSKRVKKEIIELKKIEDTSEKKYMDSTLLAYEKKESKIESKNSKNQIRDEKPIIINENNNILITSPFHNNGK